MPFKRFCNTPQVTRTNPFPKNQMLKDGVVRNLEIIGEAAKHVPQSIKRRYPGIPWSEMVGMRNKLIHEYFGVEPLVIWKTITEDLPVVLPRLQTLLRDLQGGTKTS